MDRISRYQIRQPLGEGGSAEVHHAYDPFREEHVALKWLRQGTSPHILMREFHRLQETSHPGLPRAMDLGEHQGRPYYVSELVRGDVWRPSSWKVDAERVRLVASALDYLHELGLRHGDLHVGNILVHDKRATLLDLGCARPLDTATPEVSGLLSALAPEVLAGGIAGKSADYYSLGKMLLAITDLPERIRTFAENALNERPQDRPVDLRAILGDSRPVRNSELFERSSELETASRFLDTLRSQRRGPRELVIRSPQGSGRTRLMRAIAALAFQRGVEVWDFPAHRPFDLALQFALPDWLPGAAIGRQTPRLFLVDDADRFDPGQQLRLCELAEALSPEQDVALVHVSERAIRDDAVELAPAPLTRKALERWFGDPALARKAFDKSGGYPGRLREDSNHSAAKFEGPTTDVQRAALALLTLLGDVPTGTLHHESFPEGSVQENAGRLVPTLRYPLPDIPLEPPTFDVARMSDAMNRAATLGSHLIARRYEDFTTLLKTIPPSEVRANSAYRRILEALTQEPASEASHHRAEALLATRLGEARQAHEAFQRITDAHLLSDRFAHARCLLRLEQIEGLEELLGAIEEQELDEAQQIEVADLRARALLKRGLHREALASLRELGEKRERHAQILESEGVALSYLGEAEQALEILKNARSCLSPETENGALTEARILSYIGIAHSRRGEYAMAAVAYEDALGIADQSGLYDQVAAMAMNAGTARHVRGDYSMARRLYRRGRLGAKVHGQTSTEALLLFNLAQLLVDIGASQPARTAAEEAQTLSKKCGFPMVFAAGEAVLAEAALLDSQFADATHHAELSTERLREIGCEREAREVALLCLRAHLAAGRTGPAAKLYRELSEATEGDKELRSKLVLAALPLQREEERRGALEKVIEYAKSNRLGTLHARSLAALSRLWSQRGGSQNARNCAIEAMSMLENFADGLPSELESAFWEVPWRREVRDLARGDREITSHSPRAERLQRLLAINRAMSSTLDTDLVLRMAMDAAIDLTGAERGFLVLKENDELVVRAARNLDREKIGQSRAKLSWSVAERVVESGEPLLTMDASDDNRLKEQHSVHAMKLRSILAVPLPGAGSIRGALYLDNRFRRGRFAEDDVDLLMSFADQLAVALRNASQLEALEAQKAALEEQAKLLEAERARVQALSEGQAIEIANLTAQVQTQRESLKRRYDYGALIARSPGMRAMLDTLDRVIDSPLSLLVEGESGTGKELVARAAHDHSRRSEGPFVAINCAALPEQLLESELFGHVKGAFSGADKDKLGLMRAAEGGTLFLDELGELPLATQAKLLRALESREVRAVGGTQTHPVDFRLVAATNRDLLDEVDRGRFREDLFYRVGVVRVAIPSLRERKEDVLELATLLLSRVAEELEREGLSLSPRAAQQALEHDWPGNVRELFNVLRTAAVLSDADTIDSLPIAGSARRTPSNTQAPVEDPDTFEKRRILLALEQTLWNVGKAAEALQLSRATLYRRMKRHDIAPRKKPRRTIE